MKLFSEKVEATFTNSSFNVLQVENFSEIFFDVYEIELNKIKYPVEKISSFRGNPVVSVPVVIGEKEQEYPFVLIKGSESIVFNEQNNEAPFDDMVVVESSSEDVIFENIDLDRDNRIKESTRRELLQQIEVAKANAKQQAETIKHQKIKEADIEIRKKNKILTESLNTAKQELVKEFLKITKSLKNELVDGADDRYREISITVDNKITDLADRLSESITSDFENSSSEFESKIRDFVKSLHNESVVPELRKSLETIAIDAVDRIKTIEVNLEKQLSDKAEISVIEELSQELDILRNGNIELNNNINKGVNKALSRIGNVNNRIDEVTEEISKQVDERVSNVSDELTEYYSAKLQSLEDQTFDLNEKSRQYVIDLVQESRNNLISEIRKIQKSAPIEYIIESEGEKKVKSFDVIEKDINKKIADKIADEVVKLRKYVAVYSSGGGSVAQQFANGGVMNGNLTIFGTISASQYLGLSGGGGGGVSGDYLPLSGGTLDGDLNVDGFLTVGDSVNFDGGVEFRTFVSDKIDLIAPNINLRATNGVSLTGNLSASGIINSPEYDVTGTVGGEFLASKSVAGWAFTNTTTPVLTADTSPQAVFFKPDGSVMYVLETQSPNQRVYAYNVPTPWDVSTVSATPTLSSVAVGQNMQGLYFSPDGRYFFTLITNRAVNRYIMPIGSEWNVSTGVLSGSFTPGASQTGNRGITFKPDGSKMYVFDDNTNFVYEYNLNPAWDVTTATDGPTVAFPNGTSDITISSDGTRLIATATDGTFNRVVFEYTLPTPWSVTGAFFKGRMFRDTNFTVFPAGGPAVLEATPTGIYYNDELNKFFFVGSGARRVQEIDVTPQPAIVGTRPIIYSNSANSVADRVSINSLQITDTTATTTNATGALLVAGGVGVGGAINAGGAITGSTFTSTVASGTAITLQSNVGLNWLGGGGQGISGFSGRLIFGFPGEGVRMGGTYGGIRTANYQVGAGTDVGTAAITSPAAGVLTLGNSATTDFARLQFGGVTASFPAIRRNGTGIDIRDAADTGFTDLRAANITSTGILSSSGISLLSSGNTTLNLYNTYTDDSNYERGFVRWNTNTLQVGTDAAGTGSNRNISFVAGGNTRMTITSAGLVGIGTTTPTEKLTVVGNISATGGTVYGNGFYFSGLSNTGLYANINSVFIQGGTGTVRFFNGSIRVSQTAGIGFSGNVTGGAANNASINWMSPGVLSIGAGDGAGRTDGSLALTNLSAFSVNLSGDIEVTDPTKGVILKSPNGTRFRITVTNSGALSTTQV